MVSMLEELEKLALELGQTLPRIVVTCSTESLSSKAAMINPAAKSAELLRPPPTAVAECPEERDAIGGGYSLAKEKCRLIEPEPEPGREEEQAKASATSSSAMVSSPSEQSLTCIYLPEVSARPKSSVPTLPHSQLIDKHLTSLPKLAPEFLSGSSTSPILQPADGFHSKPPPPPPPPTTTKAHSSPQRAFFAALREREPARSTRSGIARRFAAAARPPTEPKPEPKDVSAAPPAPPRSRVPMKSALPVLKARSTASVPVARVMMTLASESKSPDPKAPLPIMPAMPQGAHAAVANTATTGKPSFITNAQQASRDRDRGGRIVDERRSLPAPATPTPIPVAPLSSARKLKHFFRRPPTRSASDPPAYKSARQIAEGGVGVGAKRPASEVVQTAPREVIERSRMPRLPSARDLIRKLT